MNVFEITVQRITDGRWPVVTEHSRAGALPTMKQGWLELDQAELVQQVSAQDYGRALGRALFRDDLRDAFVQALSASDERLRVLLYIEDEKLRTLRWERLCAPLDGQWGFLLLNQRTPFSLYLPSVTDRRFPPFGRLDLRALIVAASPDGLEKYRLQPFDAAAAVQRVRTALGDIPSDTLAVARDVPDAIGPPTLDALAAQITAQPYTLLHVICHGSYVPKTGETVVFAANSENQVESVTASALIERLRSLQGVRGLPQLAFLATCESAAPEAEGALGGLGQRLVRELGMPAVVAMTERVSVETAQTLSAAFYSRLREHGEVDLALAEATAGLADRPDVTVPALFSRLGGRPLFSDALDREPTSAEIARGLDQLARLLAERAPILLPEFNQVAQRLRSALPTETDALSPSARKERKEALTAANTLCEEVLDLSFNGLCFGRQPPLYDPRCPFPGLVAFDADASDFFFGREMLVEQLATRLVEHNFLPVLGPSGCGKSSLILAGLVPALQKREPGLQVAILRPGSDPVAQLDKALGKPTNLPVSQAPRPMLVVDQFEELFTLTQDEAQRRTFVERLLAETSNCRVALTMRADFLDDCATYNQLYAALQSRLQLIPPMSQAELRSAMEQQAKAVELRFEPDLVNTILDDVAGEPGAMPLLQHGLLELWKRRHGRWLRASEYREMGGVQQAIARTAEGVYGVLPPDEQGLVRNICLRLVRLDESDDHRDTRRRVAFDKLVTSDSDRPAVVRLVNRLADEKLVVTSVNPVSEQQEVELAHEALIGEWKRLQGWIEEDRRGNLIRQQLSQAADEWDRNSRDRSYLFSGKRLADSVSWNLANRNALNATELAFLKKSQASAKRQRVVRAAVLAAIAAIIIVAAGSILYFWKQKQISEAEAQSKDSLARAEQKLLTDPLESLDLSTNALPIIDGSRPYLPQAEFALTQALAANQERGYRSVASSLATTHQVAFSPSWIATGGDFAHLVSLDLSQVIPLTSSADPVQEMAWSDSNQLLLGRTTNDVRVWDTKGREVAVLPLDNGASSKTDRYKGDCERWRPGSEQILICLGRSLVLWTPAQLKTEVIKDLSSGVTGARWSADGQQLAAWDEDDNVLVWDANSNQSQLVRASHPTPILAAAWAPDNARFVTASNSVSNTLQIWPADSLNASPILDVDVSGTDGIEFVDAERFVTWELGGDVRLWTIGSREPQVFPVPVTDGRLQHLELAPDKMSMLGMTDTGTAFWWRLVKDAPTLTLRGHTDPIVSVLWGDKFLVTGSQDGTARIWDAIYGLPMGVLRGHRPGSLPPRADVLGARWQDDRHLLTAGADGSLRLWEAFNAQGAPLCVESNESRECRTYSSRLIPSPPGIPSFAWAGWLDDDELLVVDQQNSAGILTPETGKGQTLADGCSEQREACWSPDGKYLLTLKYNPDTDSVEGQVREFASQRVAQAITGSVEWAGWIDNELLLLSRMSGDEVLDLAAGKNTNLIGSEDSGGLANTAHLKGNRLAIGRVNGQFDIWDVETGSMQYRLPEKQALPRVDDVRWSDNGDLLLIASQGKVAVWRDGEQPDAPEELSVPNAAGKHTAAVLSPDGRYVAASADGDLFLFDLKTPNPLVSLKAHTNTIGGLQWLQTPAWPTDGSTPTCPPNCRSLLLTWSGDGTARLWHVLPDKQNGGPDLVEIWRATDVDASQRAARSFKIAAVSNDFSQLLTLSDSGDLRIWRIWVDDPQKLIDLVKQTLQQAGENRRLP